FMIEMVFRSTWLFPSVGFYRRVGGRGIDLLEFGHSILKLSANYVFDSAIFPVKSRRSRDLRRPAIAARPISRRASSVLAPMFGVASRFGTPANHAGSGGSRRTHRAPLPQCVPRRAPISARFRRRFRRAPR